MSGTVPSWNLEDYIVCPNCRTSGLTGNADLLVCSACQKSYPSVGGIPLLVPNPDRWKHEFQAQLAVMHSEAELTIETFQREARKPGLLVSTKSRLTAQAVLTQQLLQEVDSILRPAIGAPLTSPQALPSFQPMAGLHFLHRDWSWPESDENQQALSCVERVLQPGTPVGRMLVLGTGGSRMAYDLHTQYGGQLTVAVDVDPLVLLVAKQLFQGNELVLTEARSNATELAQLSARRRLKPPEPQPENLHLVLANALEVPVKAGAFDTVLTPWFIDLVPEDLREFLHVIWNALAPDGVWLNYGPLLYPHTRPAACRYSRQELLELAELSGFQIEAEYSEVLPFSFSPLTDRGRLEGCLAFRATKHNAPHSSRAPQDPPAWVILPHLPIPRPASTASAADSNQTVTLILALLDGTRSINDLVTEMSKHTSTSRAAVADMVRHCLLAAHPACAYLTPEAQ